MRDVEKKQCAYGVLERYQKANSTRNQLILELEPRIDVACIESTAISLQWLE